MVFYFDGSKTANSWKDVGKGRVHDSLVTCVITVHGSVCACTADALSQPAGVTHLCSTLQHLGHSRKHGLIRSPYSLHISPPLHSVLVSPPVSVYETRWSQDVFEGAGVFAHLDQPLVSFPQGGVQLQTGPDQHHLPEGK